MKWIVTWLVLAACLFCAVNWFILPAFPGLVHYVPSFSVLGAVGASALLVIGAVLFGRGK